MGLQRDGEVLDRTQHHRSEVLGTSEIDPAVDNVLRAFLWTEAGGMRSLGTLGSNSFAFGINNRREVVGLSRLLNGKLRAFLWRPGAECGAWARWRTEQ